MAPLLSKIKIAFSRTKAPKATTIVPILAQAAPVDLLSESGSKPFEPPQPEVALASDILSLETPPALPPTLSATATQPGAPLTINDLPPEILAEVFYTYMFCEAEPDHLDPELEGLVSVFLP
ncbi:hypothetical protein CVT24_009989, partial [Panaeolus cyanescens]